MLVAENWIDKMARVLNKTPEYLRQLNFVKEGETTHYGQVMESSQVGSVIPPAFALPFPSILPHGRCTDLP